MTEYPKNSAHGDGFIEFFQIDDTPTPTAVDNYIVNIQITANS